LKYKKRKIPHREIVFLQSLKYHGFRRTLRRKNLKYRKGYVIFSTTSEDASGIDFWVKMPKDERLIPVQVTQRGVKMYRKYSRPVSKDLEDFITKSNQRIQKKRHRAYEHGIAFALVRDFGGVKTNPQIAWGDIKALRHGIAHLKQWLE